MKKCPDCGKEVSKSAKRCPNCGKKLKKPIVLFVILGIIAIAIIGAALGGGNNETSQEEKFTHTVTNSYLDEAGFAYYIEGTVKNETDKEYSYVQIEFVCYDAEGNNLGTAVDNTNSLLGNETWKFKAMGMFTNENVDHCDFKEITSW